MGGPWKVDCHVDATAEQISVATGKASYDIAARIDAASLAIDCTRGMDGSEITFSQNETPADSGAVSVPSDNISIVIYP